MTLAEIAAARQELNLKSREQVEIETAQKWGARAIAAYEFYASTGDPRWLVDAVTYHGEAVEHAATVNGALVDAVEAQIKVAKFAATGT